MKNPKGDDHMRQLIANEAARIVSEEGVENFYTAKRKAVNRIGGNGNNTHLPTNKEITEAMGTYQRLFLANSQPQHLKHLRQAAAEALAFFSPFSPRLVGSVLSGNAGLHSDVNLHLFADYVEAVDMFLLDHKIPFERKEKKIKYSKEQTEIFPSYTFMAGDVEIDLVVFPINGIRQSPRSPVDGKPMKRATLEQVKKLLDENQPDTRFPQE